MTCPMPGSRPRRKGHHHAFALQFGQAVIQGQSRCTGTFHHRFGVFRQSEDRHGDGFFVHLHHLINMLLNEMERVVAYFGTAKPSAKVACMSLKQAPGCWAACTGRANGFHPDHLHFGLLGFDRERDAGKQANWHHHGVEPGHLRQLPGQWCLVLQ